MKSDQPCPAHSVQGVNLAWSPDGERLALSRREASEGNLFEGRTQVGVVASRGGEPRIILEER